MKTKNMRKKALLSSVAMLLVAVVALSGATYAWFTATATAQVKGIQMATAQSTSLKFCATNSSTETDWKSAHNFAMESAPTIQPCSTINGDTLYYVTASGVAPASGEHNDTVVSSITQATAYTASSAANATAQYVQREVWVKAASGGALKVQSIASTGITSNIRVSVKPGSGTTLIYKANDDTAGTAIGLKAEAATADLKIGSGESQRAVTFGDLYGGVAADVGTWTGTQTISSSSDTLVSLQAGTPVKLTINVWLEGNNATCNDLLAAQTMDGLTITFTIA